MRVATVLIQTKEGAVAINESDFDTKIHKKFSEKKSTTTRKKAPAKKAE